MLLTSSYDHFKSNKKMYKELLLRHMKLEKQLLNLLYNDNIELTEFKNTLNDIVFLQKETSNILNIKYDNINHELGNLITIKEKDIDDNLLTSYFDLKKEIITFQNILEQNNIPNLELSKIIDFLNKFSKYLLKDENFIETKTCLQTLCLMQDDNNNLPLSLKSGRKIILKNRNFDLTSFTYDELLEILRVLDIIIKDDQFEYLRVKITEQLANISSISFPE